MAEPAVAAGRSAGRGGAGRGGGGAAQAATPPAQTQATPPAQATTPPAQGQAAGAPAAGQAAAPATPERRKDPGSDLIIRNLATGQDVTIPEVTEFAWDKTGSWLVYAVSSPDAAKDGAFARRMSDGTVRALLSGRGRYKSLAIDESGTAGRVPQRQGRVREACLAVPPLLLEDDRGGGDSELVSAATRGMPQGMVVADSAPQFTEDGQRLLLATAPPPAPPADPTVRRPAPIPVDLWSYKDPQIQPMQRVRAPQDQNRNYRAVVHLSDKRFVQLATPDLPTVNPGLDPNRAIGSVGPAVPAGSLVGPDLQRRVSRGPQDRGASQGA